MTKVGLFQFLIALFFVAHSSYAQKKVKYKDIWGFLSTQQYQEAEPFLRIYLQENDDNPNAFLFMGIILQEKASHYDILKDTKELVAVLDSAVFFYQKAHSEMTEKELRKNKEYYQQYNRRDLRTGEFGIKLGDVQFDLEKKVEAIKIQADQVKLVHHFLSSAQKAYDSCIEIFARLQEEYRSKNDLLLSAGENTLNALNSLALKFDSVTNFVESYQAGLKNIGDQPYHQEFFLRPINKMVGEGVTPSNFLGDEVQLWDYKTFAEGCLRTIEEEIMPMEKSFLAIEDELNVLREKVNDQGISVLAQTDKVEQMIDKLTIGKFDESPFPLYMFTLKLSDVKYKSTRITNTPLKDSADISFQLSMAQQEHEELMKLDKAVSLLQEENLTEEEKHYKGYISSAYHNIVILESYIKATAEYVEREKIRCQERLDKCLEASRWLVVNQDSIPLFQEGTDSFQPLILEPGYTAGLKFKDSVQVEGYFYDINNRHRPAVSVNFGLEGNVEPFTKPFRGAVKGLGYSADGQIFYLAFFRSKSDAVAHEVVVAKIYRSDGLSWTKAYTLPDVPQEITYDSSSGNLVLKGTSGVTQFDKNGRKL